MGDRDADGAVGEIEASPPRRDAAFIEDSVEYEDTRDLSDTLSDAVDEISEAWDRMRDTIGPF